MEDLIQIQNIPRVLSNNDTIETCAKRNVNSSCFIIIAWSYPYQTLVKIRNSFILFQHILEHLISQ